MHPHTPSRQGTNPDLRPQDQPEIVKQNRDPKLLVQLQVLRGLQLGHDEMMIMDRYKDEYAEQCWKLMTTDPEVMSALHVDVGDQGEAVEVLAPATALLIQKLQAWKPVYSQAA